MLIFQDFCYKLAEWNMDHGMENYYIPINDTTLELSVFWPSATESRIN